MADKAPERKDECHQPNFLQSMARDRPIENLAVGGNSVFATGTNEHGAVGDVIVPFSLARQNDDLLTQSDSEIRKALKSSPELVSAVCNGGMRTTGGAHIKLKEFREKRNPSEQNDSTAPEASANGNAPKP